MNIRLIALLLGPVALLVHAQVFAQEISTSPTPEQASEIFARQGGVVLTQGELDAAFSRIPAEFRLRYIRDGDRVDDLVKSLLRTKLVAADAARSDFDQSPLISTRLQLAAEKELAEAWVENLLENAPEGDYEAIGREYYLAHPDEFQTPEMVDVSHILISSETRSSEEALELASSIREDLLSDPSQFDAFVTEFSEDPAKATNGGRYPGVQRGQMVKRFEDMAFSLRQPGEISEPVETNYGYHIIRLNSAMPSGTVPFEQIKQELAKRAEEQHLSKYRARYIQSQIAEPIELSEGAVDTMIKRYFGDDFELVTENPE